MSDGLFNPNATALERRLAEVCADAFRNQPVVVEHLWNADQCPPGLLPWLAWANSVDRWDADAPTDLKRRAIREARHIHSHKGTLSAIRRAVADFGRLDGITEWWQTTPPGEPGTFQLRIELLNPDDATATTNLLQAIDITKPISRHLTRVSVISTTECALFMAAACVMADAVTVYPWSAKEVQTNTAMVLAVAAHSAETTTTFPQVIHG